MFLLILERRREKKRNGEGEKHQCDRETSLGCFPYCTQNRDQTHNLGMFPDWELNQQPFGVQENAPTNWATQTGMASIYFIFDCQRSTWVSFSNWRILIRGQMYSAPYCVPHKKYEMVFRALFNLGRFHLLFCLYSFYTGVLWTDFNIPEWPD